MNSVPPFDPSDNTKYCHVCEQTKACAEFYLRSGIETPTRVGDYITPCKQCRRANQPSAPERAVTLTIPMNYGEQLAMNYLLSKGIPTLPGKAVAASDVDLVCWGAVWVEVKYGRIRGNVDDVFLFATSRLQRERGFLAHVVILVCDYETQAPTFHVFDARDPVFYRVSEGHVRMKNGVYYRYGATESRKQFNGRTFLLKAQMDAALDHVSLLRERLAEVESDLLAGFPQAYSMRREPQSVFYQQVVERMQVASAVVPPTDPAITVDLDGMDDEAVGVVLAEARLLATAQGETYRPTMESVFAWVDAMHDQQVMTAAT